jgi:4'-phosphopantetheinyl transferase
MSSSDSANTLWREPAGDLTLAPQEVHIWRISLAQVEDTVHRLRALLSPDEIQRADRFYFERDRRRFTVARAAMRQILGHYLGLLPAALVFAYGEKGKPELATAIHQSELRFNLSHSGEFALLGVAKEACLGIDIEFINHEFASEEIGERFFSRNEVMRLQAAPRDKKAEAFFSCWTRKEAYIKALGEGLSVPLDSFEVAFGDLPAALLRVDHLPEEQSRWSMYDIQAVDEYKSALVVEGQGFKLRHWQWKGFENCDS